MTRLRWSTLGAVTIVVGTLSAVGLRWWTTRGHVPLTVPLLLAGVLLALAALVLVFGLRVRRDVRGQTLDDPVGRPRTPRTSPAGAHLPGGGRCARCGGHAHPALLPGATGG